ncbi:DUF2183 domain-containing protein [Rhodopirellula sp. JC740]|uniref:DUF2183 domain-containing protein n=1 Tax=Rhodopirellula halodulae TaxID=2894198 RepID=A0ABS8NER6_9BACT|nr:phosphatase domain-containing protein [Rhodopirellula sp. JC740]MCC9642049.1 DUF2183 domain-containing protein [Rhodopirellula sp. JC740]
MQTSDPSSLNQQVRRWLTRAASSVDDFADDAIRKLRRSRQWVGVPQIQSYRGYATPEHIHLRGRVLTNPPREIRGRQDRWWQNLSNSYRRFASDEVPGVLLEAEWDGETYPSQSDREGYFHFQIPDHRTEPASQLWTEARVCIAEHDAVSSLESITTCPILNIPETATYGVISDVDDTILHSSATDFLTMAKLTLLSNARSRAPLEGAAELYQCMQRRGTLHGPNCNPIFYVSSSPWNLYDLLDEFLQHNSIPSGPLFLRDLGVDPDKFIAAGHDHKLHRALEIMNDLPHLPFVLVGDSGQQDARLYATAAEKMGDRIRAIFIRDVDPLSNSKHDERVTQWQERSYRAGVPMHLVKDSTEAAEIAVQLELLQPETLATIREATDRDHQRG